MDNEFENALNYLRAIGKSLEGELDRYLNERAKKENKTQNQVCKEIMESYEGMTWGDFLAQLKKGDKNE